MHPETERDEQERGIAGTRTAVPRFSFTDRRHKATKEQAPHLRNTNGMFTTHKRPTYEAQVTHLRKANGPSATHKHPIHDSKPHIYLFIWLPTKNKQAYFALFPICIIFAQQALQNPAYKPRKERRNRCGTLKFHVKQRNGKVL